MAKIEMLDDDGNVTEVCEAQEHRCSPDDCETPAYCEDCGATGETTVIYIWTSSAGMEYFVCAKDLAEDEYARLAA